MTAYIDSIDGSLARVLLGEEGVAVSIPVSQLPPRAHPGMVLHLRFTVDQAATSRALAKDNWRDRE